MPLPARPSKTPLRQCRFGGFDLDMDRARYPVDGDEQGAGAAIHRPSAARASRGFPRVRAIVARIVIAPVAIRRHRNAELIRQRLNALIRWLDIVSCLGWARRVRVKPGVRRQSSSDQVFCNSLAHCKGVSPQGYGIIRDVTVRA